MKVLDRRQAGWTLATATVSSATFVFSPVAMTVILGEVVGSLSASEFLAYGMLAVVIAILIAYPFSMNFAHRAASFVSRRISHEAVIATFVGPCSACRPSSPCSAEMTLPCSATQPLRLRGFTRLQERKISDWGRFAAHRRQAGLPQVRRKTQP
ncbi:hypothetical protein PPUJ21368_24010 [Pseudomonas putida]|nr:hypothetical protein PPUJ21368_24010 [Pseudomonas putida]